MKITEKVKCKICGDIITLKNNDKYVECKEDNQQLQISYKKL